MKFSPKKIFQVLLLTVLLIAIAGPVQAQPKAEQTPAGKKELPAAVPGLAEIIPMASSLRSRLAQLENNLKAVPNLSSVEKKYSESRERVEGFGAQLEEIKTADVISKARLVSLRRKLNDERTFFKFVDRLLSREISRVDAWKTEWLEEKNRWRTWETNLVPDREPEQIRSTFTEAQATIDNALSMVLQQLEAMLLVQTKGSAVKDRITTLEAEAQALISAARRNYLFAAAPPMLSRDYLAQFRNELWEDSLGNLSVLAWPDSRFFIWHGWPLLTQFFIFLAVAFIVRKNRQALAESENWRFFAARPFSAGIFIAVLTHVLFSQYSLVPTPLRLLYTLAGGVSFIRLLGCLLEMPWKRQAAYGVMTIYIVSNLIRLVNLPLPLYRLYTLLVSLLALYFLWHWAAESVHQNDKPLYAWMLRLGSVLPGVIVFTQLLGREGLAAYLFESTLSSLAITLAILLFIHMIRGCLHWVFFASPVWQIKQLRSEADALARRAGFLVESAIILFILLPILLSTWNLFGSVPQAAKNLLSFGFDIGSERISVGLAIGTAGTLYGSLLLSWILPKVFLDEKVLGHDMERGVRISVGRLIQYFIIFIGFILTLTILGLDFTKLTIILSALGVGIGFGLQGIVNNFVSGLILLFEQPLRVGDSIEFGGNWANIKKIGLRSTTVQTLDQAEVIIPNADLVNNQLTNWTLSNRQGRIKIPVGVAYGSDVSLVIETLLACAAEHDMIAKSPPPQVLFLAFGESSLNFELRVWIRDVDNRLQMVSELHQKIDRSFRDANIEIAFPQRDLHLRSIDSSVVVQHSSGESEAL